MPQNNGNISVLALSEVALPSPGEFTLFFDTENSDKLTSVGNIAGIRVVRVYDFSGGLYKGLLDASANPLYPAAVQGGEYYIISVSGKVGGGSGKVVNAGDLLIANAPNVGGTEAAVGTFWDIYANAFDLPIASKSQAYAGINNASISTPLAVRYGIQGGAFMTSAATGTNTYITSMTGTLADYNSGSIFELYINNENTGASTLNIDALGALPIVKADPNIAGTYRPLVAGDIKIGYNRFVYDSIAIAFVLISRAGQNTFNKGKIIYVDSIYGNNNTAQKYNQFAPYQTPTAANAAAVSGDLIEVLPGAYTVTTALGKDGVNWYFHAGAAITNNTTNIFDDLGSVQTYNITGYGSFLSTGHSILNNTAISTVNFEFENIFSISAPSINVTGGTYTINGKNLISVNTTAYKVRSVVGIVTFISNVDYIRAGQIYDIATTAGGHQIDFEATGNFIFLGTLIGSFLKSVSFAGDGSDLNIVTYGDVTINAVSLVTIFDGWLTHNGNVQNNTIAVLVGVATVATVGNVTINGNGFCLGQLVLTLLASTVQINLNGDFIANNTGVGTKYSIEMSGATTAKINVKGLIQNNGTVITSGGVKKVDGAGSGDFILQILSSARIVLSAAAIGAGAKSILGDVFSFTSNDYPGSTTNGVLGGTVVEAIGVIVVSAAVQ